MAGSTRSGVPLGFKLRTINLTEFREQVKDNWVKHALKTNTGEQTRARVLLRRDLGREPTRAEVEAVKKDKSLKGRVTAAQIVADFNSGTEVRPAFTFKLLMDNIFD